MRGQPVSTEPQLPEKLLTRYEALRREEYEQIGALLDVLAQVDGLPEASMEQARDALFHANYPFMMAFVGPFGSGKSSLINALIGEEILDVGPIPTTDHIVIVRHGADVERTRSGEIETIFHPSPLLENLSLVDTPGLESVFRTHEELTRRFLHRADVVLLVMIATQVLTATNLEYLQRLTAYGKRVMVVVNQVDLLSEEERAQVREFVREQCRLQMGFEPRVWLASSKLALEAQREHPRDEILWDESGLADIEEFIRERLSDLERHRQKLQTPLQICQNVTKEALALVQEQQSALDEHRKTVDNIEAQIEQGRREQQRAVEEALEQIGATWDEVAERGSAAIGDLFQFSRGFGLFFAGLGELSGLGRLVRRFRRQTRAEQAFEAHKVNETLKRVPQLTERLGPRLEGRDLQDIDDLVDYTRRAAEGLPPRLADKLIGTIQTPMHYDRGFLRSVGADLDALVRRAERFETDRLDRTLRNTLIILALWEIIVIVLVVATLAGALFNVATADAGAVALVFAIGIGGALLGLGLVPLRGWLLRRQYERRIRHLRDEYVEKLRRAADEAVAHGVQLRRDAVAPFTRLITSQTEQLEALRTDLLAQQQAFIRLQSALAALTPRAETAAQEEIARATQAAQAAQREQAEAVEEAEDDTPPPEAQATETSAEETASADAEAERVSAEDETQTQVEDDEA